VNTLVDKSKGLKRIVDGIEFYGGLYSPHALVGEINGKLIYVSSPQVLVTPDEKLDDVIRYYINKVRLQ
jgi:hypothetical protein